MEIKRVGLIGAGTMGSGIAQIFAGAGYSVVLCDVEQRFLNRGLETIIRNLDREVAKDKISAEDKEAALRRIDPVTDRAQAGRMRFHRGSGDREDSRSRRKFFAISTGWRGRM